MSALRFSHWIVALALAGLNLVGCVETVRVQARSGPTLPVEALAIYPCRFRWDEPAYRAYEVSQALTMQVINMGRYAVYGPDEFKTSRLDNDDNPFAASHSYTSDTLLGLADRGIAPEKLLMVRPSLERRVKTQVNQVYDAHGKFVGARSMEEVTIAAQIEIFHPSTRERIAEISDKIDLDPFLAHDTDPMPEVSTLLSRMMETVLNRIVDRAPGQLISRGPGFEFVWNPKSVLEFSLEGKPSLAETMGRLNVVEQDLAVEERLRFFLPNVDPATLSMLRRLPGGLLVTAVGDSSKGLRKGDLITVINGEPASPQALNRALRATPAKPLVMKVQHNARPEESTLAASNAK